MNEAWIAGMIPAVDLDGKLITSFPVGLLNVLNINILLSLDWATVILVLNEAFKWAVIPYHAARAELKRTMWQYTQFG